MRIMILDTFKDRIPTETRVKLSDATVALWHSIQCHISEHGQSDRFDASLSKRVREVSGKWVSEATLQRHLKRMTDAGLLQGHRVLVKYTPLGKLMGG